MNTKEKFQAVFTCKRKKPTFKVGKNTTSKEQLNYEMVNYSQQKTKFISGDVVRGSKNSYKMTVEQSDENTTDCVYFDISQNLHRITVDTAELEIVSQ